MDYYSKYLKYKKKLIALKNKQIGGVNFCTKENIFDHNKLDSIVFNEVTVDGQTINIDFIVHEKEENQILIISKIKNSKNESILEIEFCRKDSEIHAYLKYLRSNDEYNTKRLINYDTSNSKNCQIIICRSHYVFLYP